MKSPPIFEMRGLCYGTSFDAHFGWTGQLDSIAEKYSFRGFTKSILQWNAIKKEWNITLYNNEKTYAFCNETEEGYPFGTYKWYFVNDTCSRDKPDKNGVFTFTTNFSPCSQEEYSCRYRAIFFTLFLICFKYDYH